MPQAPTFGRRGIAAPTPVQPAYRPAPKAPAAAQPDPLPALTAAVRAQYSRPDPKNDSLVGYLVWLLFRFDGRLSRLNYRYCRVGANMLFLTMIYALRAALPGFADNMGAELLIVVLMLAALVLMVWTTLAMQVKRRHDRDKSWPWLFVGFIPFFGPLWVLIETCWLDGTAGYNQFDDPTEIAARHFA